MWELVLKICCLSYYSNSVVFQFLIDSGCDVKLLPRRHTDVSAAPLNIAPHLKRTQMKRSHIVLFFFLGWCFYAGCPLESVQILQCSENMFLPPGMSCNPLLCFHTGPCYCNHSHTGGTAERIDCILVTLQPYVIRVGCDRNFFDTFTVFLQQLDLLYNLTFYNMLTWEYGTFWSICLLLRLTHACGSLIQTILRCMKKLCKWNNVHTSRGCTVWIMWRHEDAILKHLHHCSIFYTPPPLQMCFISLLCLITLEQHYQLSEADVLL